VRPEGHTPNSPLVSRQRAQLAALGRVPQANGVITTAGSDEPAVRIHGRSYDPGTVTREGLNRRGKSRRNPPHLEGVIAAGGNQPAAVRMINDGMDRELVPG